MLTLAAFLGMIAILVTIHEYGHYWMARRCGVTVLKFSIGFGKPLVQWKSGDTVWQIALIPLGGFVQMKGEADTAGASLLTSSDMFSSKRPWQKMLIVLAGPLANLLLAWGLFAGLLAYGQQAYQPVVGAVLPDSSMARAGIHAGDQFLSVEGHPVKSWESVQLKLLLHVGHAGVALEMRDTNGRMYSTSLDMSGLGKMAYDAQLMRTLGAELVSWDGQVGRVSKDGAAAKAGLVEGDQITAVNGVPLSGWYSFQSMVQHSPGMTLRMDVRRKGVVQKIDVIPDAVVVDGVRRGQIGVVARMDESAYTRLAFTDRESLPQAISRATSHTWDMTVLSLRMIGQLIMGETSVKQVSGPIGVAEYAGKSASLGWLAYLQFMAFISLSLAVLNLLPVPILDGGHFLYHTAELIRGRPLPEWTMVWGQRLGIVLLLGLMVLAFYNDITRLISG